MKTKSSDLLVSAAGKLLQQHAFDHLSDEKLSRMNRCISKLNQSSLLIDRNHVESELLELCCEANLYVETATPQVLQQWMTVMNSFGKQYTGAAESILEQVD
ncbi:MAG: hypothetical protein ACRC0I_00835 [Sediminibacterium sp.]|jgi:hypothetical protein|nr:hypothetical protein [Chitinophagaceae bacterium]MCA6446817.1 hypothetical protein [Chitinophagaceae bacterium]